MIAANPDGSQDRAYLGLPYFRSFYTTFDIGRKMIGIGVTN